MWTGRQQWTPASEPWAGRRHEVSLVDWERARIAERKVTAHSRKTLKKISRGLMSGYPLFYILGWEEPRIEQLLGLVASSRFGNADRLVVWSATSGFSDDDPAAPVTDPVVALRCIAGERRPALYLMKDLPAWFQDNTALVRAVRDAYHRLKDTQTSVFLTYPELVLPEVIKKEIFLVEMELPSEDEILAELERNLSDDKTAGTAGGAAVPHDQLYRVAVAMKGLSLNEVGHLGKRLFQSHALDPAVALQEIQEEKSQLLRKESCIRFYPPQSPLEMVGGLENLKEWVTKRKELFSEKAYAAGIPLPSGLLLMGVSGCGKSMAAKAIAAAWELPLVRLDMSLVLSGSYGSPEYAFERATKIAEEVAPIVLWIDEIENSFGFDERVRGQGNVNIFSSVLTWLQEKDPRGLRGRYR